MQSCPVLRLCVSPNRRWHPTIILGLMADKVSSVRTLDILEEHSRECLAIRLKRNLNPTEVIDALTDPLILCGVPAYIGSDIGPESIEPRLPRKNGCCEGLNDRTRPSCLMKGVAPVRWRNHCKTRRPNSALGYRPPAPKAILATDQRHIMHELSGGAAQQGAALCNLGSGTKALRDRGACRGCRVRAVGRSDFASIDRGVSDEYSPTDTNDVPSSPHDCGFFGVQSGPCIPGQPPACV
ncbi:MAG: hypothetical protein ACI9IV_002197 [Paracoccaceae bacterium]|jgi:hypothetical protein